MVAMIDKELWALNQKNFLNLRIHHSMWYLKRETYSLLFVPDKKVNSVIVGICDKSAAVHHAYIHGTPYMKLKTLCYPIPGFHSRI